MARLENYIKNSKVLEFPLFRQTFGWDCGTTALNMVLAFYGHDENAEVIIRATGAKPEAGTPIEGIKKAAKKYGLKFREDYNLSIDDLKKSIDDGKPVLIMIQAWTREDNPDWENEWDQGHYTVCIGYDKNRLFFSDPANIKKTWLSNGDLNSRWHGWDDNGKKVGHWGLVFLNKSKYSHDEVEEMG